MWTDDELVIISALQHYAYCPRQCALIHIEQVFDENVYTLRGRRLHEKVHEAAEFERGDRQIETSVPLWSDRLGLVGQADVVEFDSDGIPYPVEYKSGRRRGVRKADEVQLAAQAICLEEMLGCPVTSGAIYYHASRRRREVAITDRLRADVEEATLAVRILL